MRPTLTNKRFQIGVAAAVLLAALSWAAIHYTGDQEGLSAESGSFTIDTSDPDSATKALSLATSATSAAFTIDTREEEGQTRPFTLLASQQSGMFTIDTRDPDTIAFATSLVVAELSETFTIDTTEEGSTFLISDTFTIDTREPDERVFSLSLSLANSLDGFIIDTRQPPPEDSDGNGLHDLWELIYIGAVGSSGRHDELDGDGSINFLEFAFGTDPLNSNAPRPLEFWIDAEETEPKIVVRYWRHILAARMVNFEVLTSTELKTWSTESGTWDEVAEVIHDNGYLERITVERPWEGESPSRLFVSLRITPVPDDP